MTTKVDTIDAKLHVDIDSIYGFNHSLAKIINLMGSEATFSMFPCNCISNSTNGSRFSIDCRGLINNPISVKGKPLKNVRMEDLPNLNLFQVNLPKLEGCVMTVTMHLSGITQVRKMNYFKNVELAVVQACWNRAKKILSKRDGLEDNISWEVKRLQKFMCYNANAKSASLLGKGKTSLNYKAMLMLVGEFENAMKYFAENAIDVQDGQKTGIMPLFGDTSMKFSDEDFQQAAIFLNEYKVFTFTVAGIKWFFRKNENNTILFDKGKTSDDILLGSSECKDLMAEKANDLLEYLKDEVFLTPRGTPKSSFYYDVGYELVSTDPRRSYLINGNIGKTILTRMLK